MKQRISRAPWGWIAGWALLVAAMTTLLWGVRTRVVATLDRPEVRADWQRWRDEAQKQSTVEQGPVQRRPPKTDEPPALILMRDHFAVVVSSAVVLGSCLYAFLAIAMRGAMRTRPSVGERRKSPTSGELP